MRHTICPCEISWVRSNTLLNFPAREPHQKSGRRRISGRDVLRVTIRVTIQVLNCTNNNATVRLTEFRDPLGLEKITTNLKHKTLEKVQKFVHREKKKVRETLKFYVSSHQTSNFPSGLPFALSRAVSIASS
jgi:hypothetical protein